MVEAFSCGLSAPTFSVIDRVRLFVAVSHRVIAVAVDNVEKARASELVNIAVNSAASVSVVALLSSVMQQSQDVVMRRPDIRSAPSRSDSVAWLHVRVEHRVTMGRTEERHPQ